MSVPENEMLLCITDPEGRIIFYDEDCLVATGLVDLGATAEEFEEFALGLSRRFADPCSTLQAPGGMIVMRPVTKSLNGVNAYLLKYDDGDERTYSVPLRYDRMFDLSPLPMALVDKDVRATIVNQACQELLDLEIMDADGRCGQLIGCYNSTYGKGCGTNRPCKDCVIRNSVSKTFKDGSPRMNVEGEFNIRHKGGFRKHILRVSTIKMDEESVLLTLDDITDMRIAERALTETNRRMALLSSITRHDILNSLTVMGMLVELIKQGKELEPPESEYLERLGSAVVKMSNQMMFTKTYQDLGTRSSCWQNLGSLLDDIVGTDRPFNVVLDEDLGGIEVYADPMLSLVFHNLLDNTERHGGDVSEVKVSVQKGNGSLRIAFSDDGIGIDGSLKERVFERGFGNNSGMGLFLAREILGITDITISEEGELGKGASFLLDVPLTSHRLVTDGKGG